MRQYRTLLSMQLIIGSGMSIYYEYILLYTQYMKKVKLFIFVFTKNVKTDKEQARGKSTTYDFNFAIFCDHNKFQLFSITMRC